FDRRILMLFTQAAAMAVALALALTVAFVDSPIWIILLLATMRGTIVAFNLPARHSLIYDLVPRDALPSAIALNSITTNIAKIVGPLTAAGIIAVFGITACFLVNALSFTAVMAMLLLIDLPRKSPEARRSEPFARSLIEGLRYMRRERVIGLLVLVALVPTFFCQPYLQMLAVFSAQVFH